MSDSPDNARAATAAFEVLGPGTLATVQDLGRRGFQRFGLPVGGAMDAFALQSANLLVGNDRGAAALEIALGGLSLRALADCTVATTGADLGCVLDGQPVPLWRSFAVRRGQELTWRGPRCGAWAYLAVAGGIYVPVVLGSRSTYLRARLGGLGGRSLGKGDVLRAGPPRAGAASPGRSMPAEHIPDYSAPARVRVVLGPQDDAFSPEAIRTFLSAEFEVSAHSDRMGYRLTGPTLAHRAAADILSDAVAPGSIQVPADGLPIVLLADRPTTGGYAKIATVITADLPRMAQLRAGQRVSFEAVTVDDAQEMAGNVERVLAGLTSR